MKTLKLLLLIPVFLFFNFTTNAPGLTAAERDFAAKHLKETKDYLTSKVKGLSDAQLNFKASPDSWSIAECVEHIAISENMLWGFAQGGLKEEANPAKRSEVKMSDEAVIGLITNRDQKIKTQEAFEPKNTFGSFKETLSAFTSTRDQHIDYVKKTNDDLRNHFNEFPFGLVDIYQTILFMSGHTKRHTLQIEEVMANVNFPKK